MPLGRLDVFRDVFGGARDLQLVEQERDLLALIGEDLVLRRQLPELALEGPKGLLARLVDELGVVIVGLALVGGVREAPGLDLGMKVLRKRGVFVQRVLEARGQVDLGRLYLREAVEELVGQRRRTVLYGTGESVRARDLAQPLERAEIELDLGNAAI